MSFSFENYDGRVNFLKCIFQLKRKFQEELKNLIIIEPVWVAEASSDRRGKKQ
eukprot:SAG31_NODE_20919_length_562_cov_0.937365_1_plen_52_part_01